MKAKQENVLILYNIRSAYNVGAIFRTADAAGISHIYLVGYTPNPQDTFGRWRKDIAKAALGAEKKIPYTHVKMMTSLFKKLRKEKYSIIAIEQDEKSVDYKKVKLERNNAFILGEEVKGIPKNILDECDIVAEISMLGEKESLNVSVAAGIALFRMLNI